MTEVSLAQLSTIRSMDEMDDIAFKVINNDNMSIAINNELILKPFGQNNLNNKPNGIVLPIRRITSTLEENKQKPFAKSNLYSTQDKNIFNLKNSHSNLNGQLNICNSSVKICLEDFQNHGLDKSFTKTLGTKLRKLQKEENHITIKKNDVSIPKPRFVTTVKKGEFLEPPLEIANFLSIKHDEESRPAVKLYAYSSKPRVLDRTFDVALNTGCDATSKLSQTSALNPSIQEKKHHITKRDTNYSNNSRKLIDAPLPYSNLMFERRVIRGTTHQQIVNSGEGESAAARAAEARRRAMTRRKAQYQALRGAQLRLISPPPVTGRRHEKVGTDKYLEEIWENPPMVDICTQTDLFLDRPISPLYMAAKNGIDIETQIYPGDLFDFDMEVQPILEVLVGKTIEQALIEVLEEEELAALREQQRRFLEMRATETSEAERLEELEKRLTAEKCRRLGDYKEGLFLQKEMEQRIAAAVLMQGYMSDLIPSVLEGLEDEGFITDSIKQDLDNGFMPWLMKEVTSELNEMISSRDILTDIVREILDNRAEIYRALNTESKEESEEECSVQDIQLVQHLKLQAEISEKHRSKGEYPE